MYVLTRYSAFLEAAVTIYRMLLRNLYCSNLISPFCRVHSSWRIIRYMLAPVSNAYMCVHLIFMKVKDLLLKMYFSLTHIWTGCWGKWVFHKTWQTLVRLVHKSSFLKVIMTIRTWVIWKKNRPLTYAIPLFFISVWVSIFAIISVYLRTARCQHWVFQISFFDRWLLLTSTSSMIFSSVDPSPLTPYAGCHLTRSDSIIFASLVLFFFYNTGACWDQANGMSWKNVCPQVMLILMAIPAWRVCEFV